MSGFYIPNGFVKNLEAPFEIHGLLWLLKRCIELVEMLSESGREGEMLRPPCLMKRIIQLNGDKAKPYKKLTATK